ncbi:MAG: hypothetical protein JSW71_22130 [Gemmatimonadota bacterium]|nr:MAG: hypothetical protein JSW71_22130 [Gemmatimonadota bacterium]
MARSKGSARLHLVGIPGGVIWNICRESKDAPPKTGSLLTLMFVFYIVGLGLTVYAGS